MRLTVFEFPASSRTVTSSETGPAATRGPSFTTGFPVFRNQPFLKELPRFILSDVGVHVLDVARFLFGEASFVAARVRTVQHDVRGEDVATVLLTMGEGVDVVVELSFATVLEADPFPETLVRVEGTDGTLALEPGCRLRRTDR